VALPAGPLLFLDEPTAGLFCDGPRPPADLVRKLKGLLTIVISTTCNSCSPSRQISVIHWGQVIARGRGRTAGQSLWKPPASGS
jgi:ABC-type branched-subunit amino acid transport system ATPase component